MRSVTSYKTEKRKIKFMKIENEMIECRCKAKTPCPTTGNKKHNNTYSSCDKGLKSAGFSGQAFRQAGQRPFSSVRIRCQQNRHIWQPHVQGKKFKSSISRGSIQRGHSTMSSLMFSTDMSSDPVSDIGPPEKKIIQVKNLINLKYFT